MISPSETIGQRGLRAETEATPLRLRGVSPPHRRWEPSTGGRIVSRVDGCSGILATIVRQTMKRRYTDKQGQYLAFIYYYTKIHGRAPSEGDMQRYFNVSPPSVHQMVLTLEARGLIDRVPGQSRSIQLLIPREQLPDLA